MILQFNHKHDDKRRLGTPFSRHGSVSSAEDDQRPNTLQLNTEGLTASKISIIEQLARKNKTLASDSELLTSWVKPEQEAQSCHILFTRAVGIDTAGSEI